MHQDDQGQFSSRSKIVLKDEGRQPWRSSSASPVGIAPVISSRRLVRPTAPRSLGSVGSATTCRRWRRSASPAWTWVGNGAAELGFHDRDMVRREDFAALLHDREHTLRDAELGTLRGLMRTVRHAAPMRSHAQAGAEIHAQASGGGPGGSPRTANSRMRKNAPPWLQAWRRRRRHVRRGRRGPGARHCPEPARPREQPGPGGHVPDSLRRANRQSIYRARRASGTLPRAAVHRTATARRRVRRRRAAACVRTGRRAARASVIAGPIPHAIGDLIMALAFTRAMWGELPQCEDKYHRSDDAGADVIRSSIGLLRRCRGGLSGSP